MLVPIALCFVCVVVAVMRAIADGDLVAALSWNPLVVAGSLAFVVGGLLAPIWNQRVGRVPELRGV